MGGNVNTGIGIGSKHFYSVVTSTWRIVVIQKLIAAYGHTARMLPSTAHTQVHRRHNKPKVPFNARLIIIAVLFVTEILIWIFFLFRNFFPLLENDSMVAKSPSTEIARIWRACNISEKFVTENRNGNSLSLRNSCDPSSTIYEKSSKLKMGGTDPNLIRVNLPSASIEIRMRSFTASRRFPIAPPTPTQKANSGRNSLLNFER